MTLPKTRKKRTLVQGDQVGFLEIIQELPRLRFNRGTTRIFEARCACGTVKVFRLSNLMSGSTISCGCHAKKVLRDTSEALKTPVLKGDTHGKMTIIKEVEPVKTGKGNDRRVLCQCRCGKQKVVSLQALRHGGTVSCGCYRKSRESKRLTHGMKGTPTYYIWASMKARCNPANAAIRDRYAGRGIKVCRRWMKFENFLADMGKRPSDQHSLDRIDNDGNYCKTNCRWTTPLVQANNKSNTRVITICGVSKPRMEWCRDLGITKSMLTYRLQHWAPDRVVATRGPVRQTTP